MNLMDRTLKQTRCQYKRKKTKAKLGQCNTKNTDIQDQQLTSLQNSESIDEKRDVYDYCGNKVNRTEKDKKMKRRQRRNDGMDEACKTVCSVKLPEVQDNLMGQDGIHKKKHGQRNMENDSSTKAMDYNVQQSDGYIQYMDNNEHSTVMCHKTKRHKHKATNHDNSAPTDSAAQQQDGTIVQSPEKIQNAEVVRPKKKRQVIHVQPPSKQEDTDSLDPKTTTSKNRMGKTEAEPGGSRYTKTNESLQCADWIIKTMQGDKKTRVAASYEDSGSKTAPAVRVINVAPFQKSPSPSASEGSVCHSYGKESCEGSFIHSDGKEAHEGFPVDTKKEEIKPEPVINILDIEYSDANESQNEDIINEGHVSARIHWYDPQLTWNSSEYNNVKFLTVPQTEVWTPLLAVVNPADKVHFVGNEKFRVVIQSNGSVSFISAGDVKVSCPPDITKFPFDTQTCDVNLFPAGYFADDLWFVPLSSAINFDLFTKHSEWTVTNSSVKVVQMSIYPFLSFEISLTRNPLYFVLMIVCPTIAHCCLGTLVFYLPLETGVRVKFSITVFLSFAVLTSMTSKVIPHTSSPMALLNYLIFSCQALSGFIVFLNMYIINMYMRKDEENIPTFLRTLAINSKTWAKGCLEKSCCTERSRKVHVDDLDERNRVGTNKTWEPIRNDNHITSESSFSFNESYKKEELKRYHNWVNQEIKEKVSWKDVATSLNTVLHCMTTFVTILALTVYFIIVLS